MKLIRQNSKFSMITCDLILTDTLKSKLNDRKKNSTKRSTYIKLGLELA